MTLYFLHPLDNFLWTCRIANAPSGHTIGFGQSINSDCFLLYLFPKGGYTIVFSLINELFIYFIKDKIKLVRANYLRYFAKILS